jgi:hypothetical protein
MNPFLFVKFGLKEHIEQLYREGLLYFNPIEFFKLCDIPERKDFNENTLFLGQPEQSSLSINSYEIKSEDLIGPIRLLTNDTSESSIYSHIFCMSCICAGDTIRDDKKVFSDSLFQFGDTLLVIHNVKLFRDRLVKALENELTKSNVSDYRCGKIEYIDEDVYHGEMGSFKKSRKYSHQQEYRIALKSLDNQQEALKLYLGSLEDLSGILDVKNFKNEIILEKSGKYTLNL